MRLSPARHQAIRQSIRRVYLSQSEPQQKPQAIIIAGQPGAGKGRLAELARSDLADKGGSVLIDPDILRQRHPNYDRYVESDDKSAAERVHPDASQWAKELRQDAIEGRRNIVIDGTLNDKDKARELLKQLREAGYETEVRALAVSLRESRQSVHARYEGARERGEPARWVPEEVQDEAYKGMPVALGHVERGGWADKVSVQRRDGTVIYRNDVAAARTSGLSQLAVKAERNRDPTEAEKIRHLRAWDKIQGQMVQRGAPGDDIAKVSAYRWEVHDRMVTEHSPLPSGRPPSDRADPTPKPGADSILALSAAQKARLTEWSRREER